MIRLMFVLIISSTHIAHGYNKNECEDSLSLSFRRFNLVLKQEGEKPLRIPFSGENIILPQSYKGISITLGLPFQQEPFSRNVDNVDIWIACQPMLHCCNYSKPFESNLMKSWDKDSVGIFARWSRWEWPCFNFTPISHTQLAEVNLLQILHRSTFYNESSLPIEVNRQSFRKIWDYRLQNRYPLCGNINFNRTFVFKKIR